MITQTIVESNGTAYGPVTGTGLCKLESERERERIYVKNCVFFFERMFP